MGQGKSQFSEDELRDYQVIYLPILVPNREGNNKTFITGFNLFHKKGSPLVR